MAYHHALESTLANVTGMQCDSWKVVELQLINKSVLKESGTTNTMLIQQVARTCLHTSQLYEPDRPLSMHV